MNQKIQLSIFAVASLLIILLCVHFHLEADNPDAPVSINTTLHDPWYDEIFESRNFSNLVVSIQADENDLYSDESGILTTQYMLRGKESERPIQLFVYDQNGTPLIAQGAGIRITGSASRTAIRKSFRVISREEYDSSSPKFTYDLWKRRQSTDSYDSFIIHAVRLAADSTGIHNSVGYSLAQKAGIIDATPTVPAALYINGKYQGAYFLMNSKNDNAISEFYRIKEKENIELVSVFSQEKTGIQEHPEVLAEYLEFVTYVQTSNVNDPEVIANIEAQLDVYQCLQYYAVNLLLANGDWIDNNLQVWRCKNTGFPYQDGRWRFFLFDLDWIGSFPDSISMNFEQLTQTNDHYNLLHSLLKNPKWLAEFKSIISQMEEQAFNSETIEMVFSEEESRILDEISYDFQSDAFIGYLQYSVNSDPPEADEYLTLEDRDLLVEDFKSHMLKAPGIVNDCMDSYYPD